jgi:hypothetical protein
MFAENTAGVTGTSVYNIGSIHKIEVFTNGAFTTVWGRHIDNGTDIQGGTITGEVIGKKSDVRLHLYQHHSLPERLLSLLGGLVLLAYLLGYYN